MTGTRWQAWSGGDDVPTRRFIGGPLDGQHVPADVGCHRLHTDATTRAAYLRTDGWHHLGVECVCGAIVSAGDDGRQSADCPLCGRTLEAGTEAV
jgi:hypothetical protein